MKNTMDNRGASLPWPRVQRGKKKIKQCRFIWLSFWFIWLLFMWLWTSKTEGGLWIYPYFYFLHFLLLLPDFKPCKPLPIFKLVNPSPFSNRSNPSPSTSCEPLPVAIAWNLPQAWPLHPRANLSPLPCESPYV